MAGTHSSAGSAEPPPEPAALETLDDVAGYLRRLRAWAQNVPYPELVRRINRGRSPHDPARQTTVYDCFRHGRKRLDPGLVLEIAAALGLDEQRRSQLRRAITAAHGRGSTFAEVLPSIPAASAYFTGRSPQLQVIVEQLPAAAPPVATITGPAGVGKTELALAAADRLRRDGRYGEVQLYVDLFGFDTHRAPVPPEAVLAGMLQSLGVAAARIHQCRTAAQRRELLRKSLADRPALLVLDNAADAAQVEPLLPDAPACLALVTSRRRFDPALCGVAVSLDAMTGDEALELLRSFDHAGRADAEPEHARRLADELCFRQPLDLVALGGRLADPAEASWSLADHVARLESFPADEVSRPALAASHERLPAPVQRVFRLLTLHPGSDFTGRDVAALGELAPVEAERVLGLLYDRHLLLQRQPGRFQLHDTVRAYADRLRKDREPRSAQQAALDRLRHYHRQATRVATDHLHDAGGPAPVPPAAELAAAVPALTDVAAAVEWLDAERTNLIATAIHAADHECMAHTVAMSHTLMRYLDSSGHWLDAQMLHSHACRTDDPDDRAATLVNLGNAEWRLGAFEPATSRFGEALARFRQTGDRVGQGRVRNGLAVVHFRSGRYQEARACWQQALAAYREAGVLRHEGAVESNLGSLETRLGHHDEALDHYRRALAVASAVEDVGDEANALLNLGNCYAWLGRYDEARDQLDHASRVAQAAGLRPTEARALGLRGLVDHRQERYEAAARRLEGALERFRDLRDPDGEVEMRNHLANTLRMRGDPERAMAQHRAAQALAEEVGLPYELARAHEGIGRLLRQHGDEPGAASHWKQALEIFRELGHPDAEDVSGLLRRTGGSGSCDQHVIVGDGA